MNSDAGAQSAPIRSEPGRWLKPVVAWVRAVSEGGMRGAQASPLPEQAILTRRALGLDLLDSLRAALISLDDRYPVWIAGRANRTDTSGSSGATGWLIKPPVLNGQPQADGTTTLSVALIHRGRPVFGVIHEPALRLLHFAGEGCGAFRQRGEGAPELIRVALHSAEPPRVVRVAGTHSYEAALFCARARGKLMASRSFEEGLCRVAAGEADVLPGLFPVNDWEIAAAHCILEQAGGRLVDLDGAPLIYGLPTVGRLPFFLAYGDKRRDWQRLVSGFVD